MKTKPKQKAEELILLFKKVGSKYQPYSGARYLESSLNTTEAKQCSILLVKEMIKQLETVYYHDKGILIPYWEDVEQEIKNL